MHTRSVGALRDWHIMKHLIQVTEKKVSEPTTAGFAQESAQCVLKEPE